MRVYHVISKLIGDIAVGQKNDHHSWKELVEISKNVKFGEILYENLCW